VTNELDIDITIEAAFEEDDQPDDPEPEPPETIDSIEFDSTASQIAANGADELTDESVIAVTTSEDGTNIDQNGTDPVIYDSAPIPLVSIDGSSSVAGFGTTQLINDQTDFGTGSEEFTLNLMDELIGSGTVLWDESHGQYWTLEDDGNNSFEAFADYAENNGYSLEATGDLEGDLPDADGVAIGTPADEFTDTELTALSDFVDDGGGVLLLDQSDFQDNEETTTLNEIATELDLDFRFNSDQVEDPGGNFSFTTSEFNTDEFADLFADREGIQ